MKELVQQYAWVLGMIVQGLISRGWLSEVWLPYHYHEHEEINQQHRHDNPKNYGMSFLRGGMIDGEGHEGVKMSFL